MRASNLLGQLSVLPPQETPSAANDCASCPKSLRSFSFAATAARAPSTAAAAPRKASPAAPSPAYTHTNVACIPHKGVCIARRSTRYTKGYSTWAAAACTHIILVSRVRAHQGMGNRHLGRSVPGRGGSAATSGRPSSCSWNGRPDASSRLPVWSGASSASGLVAPSPVSRAWPAGTCGSVR